MAVLPSLGLRLLRYECQIVARRWQAVTLSTEGTAVILVRNITLAEYAQQEIHCPVALARDIAGGVQAITVAARLLGASVYAVVQQLWCTF